MPHCTQCGESVAAGGRFCSRCGHPVGGVPVAAPAGRRVRIGRAEDNDIQIPIHQTQVSRHHVVVTVSGAALVIEDMDTANGVFVNDVQVRGPTPFTLRDQVRFGSYVFDVNLLAPYLREPTRAAPPMQPARPVPPPFTPAVTGHPTFFDRAFVDEGSWMPRFLLLAGIVLLVLFFVPIAIVNGHTITAFTVLGEQGGAGGTKLAVALLPVTGVVFLVLRAMRASRSAVGVALLVAALPMFITYAQALSDPLLQLSPLISELGWRVTLGFLALTGTALALMVYSTRPEDAVVRTMLGVCPAIFLLLFLLPMPDGHSSTVPLVALLSGMDHLPAEGVIGVASLLLCLVGCLGATWFLTPVRTPLERREAAQMLSVALCCAPSVGLALVLVTAGGSMVLLPALWLATFQTSYALFPVLGGTLLFIGLRRTA